jgi:flagellar biosynthetic protein FlhB
MSAEKTEEPTPKKIQDARNKGQVWRSKDLTAVAAYLVAVGVLKATWGSFEAGASQLFAFAFEEVAHPERLGEAIPEAIFLGLRTIAVMSLPVVVAAAAMGALVEFLVVGPLFTTEPLIPRLEKLNPLPGLKNLFSKRQMVELLRSMAKIVIACVVVYGVVADALPEVVLSMRTGAAGFKVVLGELVFRISVRVGLLFVAFALTDVWWQRRAYLKDMRMSKEEVKREYRESEGDPHHKARRRQMALEILEGAQIEAVKGADVIVINPSHVAVALQYRRHLDRAPRVVCRGVDRHAEAIKALAREHGVPLVRDVPLARALLEVEVSEEIPEALYEGVAAVLNFVHHLSSGNGPAA